MANGERGHQEELVCTSPKTNIQFTLVQRQELALGCLTRLKDSRRQEKEVDKDTGKSQGSEIKTQKKRKETGKRGLVACYRKAKEGQLLV